MTMIPFNINDRVRVKLTDTGRDEYRRQFDERTKSASIYQRRMKFIPIHEDADGWSEWQLYSLMETFGHLLFNGNPNLPFETNIELIIKDRSAAN